MTERAEHGVIRSAKRSSDGSWTIETESSSGFGVSRDRVEDSIWDDFSPQKGDAITLYTRGFSQVVGLDLNGSRVFLMTDQEIEAQRALQAARMDRQKAERFERERERLDADYEALPQVFRDRIDRFRANNPNFREEFESYEMFVCKEAVQLAERAREAVASGEHAAEVAAFWADPAKLAAAGDPGEPWAEPEGPPEVRWLYWARALNSAAYDYDYQRELRVTGMSDAHSGNTAGAAFLLARAYIESPEYVARVRGAMSPLVGSDAYGDVPREEQR
jgi:hypothetical protein